MTVNARVVDISGAPGTAPAEEQLQRERLARRRALVSAASAKKRAQQTLVQSVEHSGGADALSPLVGVTPAASYALPETVQVCLALIPLSQRFCAVLTLGCSCWPLRRRPAR